MKNLWKYSGTILAATGALHSIVGLISGWQGHVAMIRDGFVNALKDDFGKNLAFWFLVCGIVIILFGITLQYYIKTTKQPAPAFLGWSMLILSAIGCIIAPVTGFWLFLPQAWIILAARKRLRKQL